MHSSSRHRGLPQVFAITTLRKHCAPWLGGMLPMRLSLIVAFVLLGCGTVKRPTEPEYQGAVPIGDYDVVVNMDYCDDAWIMTLVKQVSRVTGPGQHTSIYGMVNNVVDAAMIRDGDTLFAASPREGVLRSINQGITFAPMPGLDTVGKVRTMIPFAGEFVSLRQKGTLLRSVLRRDWTPLDTTSNAVEILRAGRMLVVVCNDGRLLVVDEQWKVSEYPVTVQPLVQAGAVSWDDSQAMILGGKTLYRVTQQGQGIRVDSMPLPTDREWRAVSVLADDIALLAGKNEVWWGSFDEPLQLRSMLEGENDKRIVSMELSDIGLIVGFRGTEQSVFVNIRNANSWEPLFRPSGQAVNDVLWISRSNGSVVLATRDGGMYLLASDRRMLLDIASPVNELTILGAHGSYPNKLITMYDGRVLHASTCSQQPALIKPPVPFAQGLRVLDASEDRWFVHDANQGLFASRDAGATWEHVNLPDSMGYLEMLVHVGKDIYAYGMRRMLHSSTDGRSWAAVFPSDDTVYTARRFGDELLVISHKGWSFVRNGKVNDRITPPAQIEDSRVFVFDVNNDIIALLTESTLYVSNDRGKRWGTLNMARESMFPYVRIANDRVFAPLPGTGLMMFDVYSDRAAEPTKP